MEIDIMLRLSEELRAGASNAASLADLAENTGYDEIQIRDAIADLQARGALVVTDDAGRYYIATQPQEWLNYKRNHLTPEALRLVKRQRAMRAMSETAARLWGAPGPVILGGRGEAA